MRAYQRLADLTWRLAADATPPPQPMSLYRETIVPASLAETFAFFGDAANLERLTPSWLNFTILTPMPVAMRSGVEIDYRIRLYGLPIPWKSRIDVWEPGVRFVDRQLVGPYRWWHHEHRFVPVPGGTLAIDHVHYVPRARWFSAGRVRRDLERIFSYRQDTMRRIFREERAVRSTASTDFADNRQATETQRHGDYVKALF